MGLLRFRNPLVYPGGQAGVNWNHPASVGLRYSLVAKNPVPASATPGSGGGMLRVDPGGPTGIAGGSNYNSTYQNNQVIPIIGPAWITVTASVAITVPNVTAETPAALTFAAILVINSSVSSGYICGNSSPNSGNTPSSLSVWSLTPSLIIGGSTQFGFGMTLAIGVPYFIVCSYKPSLGTNNFNIGVTNLLTGQVYTGVGSSAAAIPTSNSTPYWIGCRNVATTQANAWLATCMHSVAYLTAPQVKQWCYALWDFWFPPASQGLILLASKKMTARSLRQVRVLG
jgi:hypothetical protein